jgi:hypothetical protein
MKRKVTTCGANFKVTVEIDTDICGDPYMEAATQALEIVFGNGPDTADSAEVVIPNPSEEPNLGFILQMYFAEDEKDEEKHFYVRSLLVAQNAGLLWMVSQLEAAERILKSGEKL